MKRRAWIQTGLGLGLMAQGLAHSAAQSSKQAATGLHWQTTTFTGLGTTLSIRAAHEDPQVVACALALARGVVARVEDQMSLFRPYSALQQLNRDNELRNPPADLLRVLEISQRVSAQSKGAFDITVQPLWALYAEAQKRGRLPTEAEVQSARARVGWQHVQVSRERVSFAKPGMRVTLNGIAQGYASDLVRAQLQQAGIAHALINTGEWSSLGQAEGGRDWTLGIADPHQADRLITCLRLRMRGGCVATSADDQCSFSADRVHHHILNPETGYSPRDIASVTVIASTCTEADALTKVFFVAGYENALHTAHTHHVEALVVHKNSQWQATPSLSQHLLA
ncbi:FAD:protein FMN transferase [Limnohabitans sp.]|uniref:FAD:protein FMN transferase n=1 Tax=Limnohabitans sp. TaxID=1907725 RepID=UPI00286F1F98|nr:FAD:protein FMN transferase [Limnohabitans sp.]